MLQQFRHCANVRAPSSKCVANECLSVCGVTGFVIYARSAARFTNCCTPFTFK